MARSKKLTAEERRLRATLASEVSWAQTHDRAKRTEAARKAARSRFDREVDPDNILPEKERQIRAKHAERAHMARMALASARARRERKAHPS